MNKKFLFIGMAAILGASLSFFGCDDSSDSGDGGKSDKTSLETAEVKGVTVNFDTTAKNVSFAEGEDTTDPADTTDPDDPAKDGIANADLGTVEINSVRVSDTNGAEGRYPTVFKAGDSGSEKVVLVKKGAIPPTEDKFADEAVYNDEKIDDGDRFLVRVTAENGEDTKWYKITVTLQTVTLVNSAAVTVANGDNTLVVTQTEGAYDPDLKVFVKNDGTKVEITTATLTADHTKIDDGKVVVDDTNRTITITLTAADAQLSQVKTIAAVSSKVDETDPDAPDPTEVTNEAGLRAALLDPNSGDIEVTAVLTLAAPLEIPSGKNVVIEADGGLIASSTHTVTVTGTLKVAEGGTLTTDAETSVEGLAASKVTFDGGTLNVTAAVTASTDVTALFAYVAKGELVAAVSGTSTTPNEAVELIIFVA
jgi:hypothetical protein